MHVIDWLPVILEASAIGGGLLFYIKNRQARDRLRKVRYANMLLGELGDIRSIIGPIEGGPDGGTLEPLPDNVYNGLVASTNLSYFDANIQALLRDVYTRVKDHNKLFSDARIRVAVSEGWGLKPTSHYDDPPDDPPEYDTAEDIERAELLDTLGVEAGAAINKVLAFRECNKPTRWVRLLKALHWYYDD